MLEKKKIYNEGAEYKNSNLNFNIDSIEAYAIDDYQNIEDMNRVIKNLIDYINLNNSWLKDIIIDNSKENYLYYYSTSSGDYRNETDGTVDTIYTETELNELLEMIYDTDLNQLKNKYILSMTIYDTLSSLPTYTDYRLYTIPETRFTDSSGNYIRSFIDYKLVEEQLKKIFNIQVWRAEDELSFSNTGIPEVASNRYYLNLKKDDYYLDGYANEVNYSFNSFFDLYETIQKDRYLYNLTYDTIIKNGDIVDNGGIFDKLEFDDIKGLLEVVSGDNIRVFNRKYIQTNTKISSIDLSGARPAIILDKECQDENGDTLTSSIPNLLFEFAWDDSLTKSYTGTFSITTPTTITITGGDTTDNILVGDKIEDTTGIETYIPVNTYITEIVDSTTLKINQSINSNGTDIDLNIISEHRKINEDIKTLTPETRLLLKVDSNNYIAYNSINETLIIKDTDSFTGNDTKIVNINLDASGNIDTISTF